MSSSVKQSCILLGVEILLEKGSREIEWGSGDRNIVCSFLFIFVTLNSQKWNFQNKGCTTNIFVFIATLPFRNMLHHTPSGVVCECQFPHIFAIILVNLCQSQCLEEVTHYRLYFHLLINAETEPIFIHLGTFASFSFVIA